MQRQNKNNRLSVRICLLLLCLVLSSVLLVGATFGRYLQQIPPVSYPFVAEGSGALILGGVITQDWIDNGNWPAAPTGWSVEDDYSRLDFSISNGTSKESATQRNQSASVRLIAGLGIGDPKKMTVELSFQQNGETVTLEGKAEKIHEGSLLSQSFGEGWSYRFDDATGNEKQFLLTGGKLSYQNITITITGGADTTLCQLQVLGNDTN